MVALWRTNLYRATLCYCAPGIWWKILIKQRNIQFNNNNPKTSDAEENEAFYTHPNVLQERLPNIVTLMVVYGYILLGLVMRKHVLRNCNDNGERFLDFCSFHCLVASLVTHRPRTKGSAKPLGFSWNPLRLGVHFGAIFLMCTIRGMVTSVPNGIITRWLLAFACVLFNTDCLYPIYLSFDIWW